MQNIQCHKLPYMVCKLPYMARKQLYMVSLLRNKIKHFVNKTKSKKPTYSFILVILWKTFCKSTYCRTQPEKT